MSCGQPLTAPPPTAPSNPSGQFTRPVAAGAATSTAFSAFQDQNRKKRNMTLIAGGSALLVALVIGLGAGGFLHLFGSNGNSDALKKVAHTAPPAFEKVASTAPPTMELPAERVVMPDDIQKWLEHLHQTEVKRVAVTNGDIANAMVEKEGLGVGGGIEGVKSALNGVDDPNAQLVSPTDTLAKMIKDMHDKTVDLQKFFDSYPAPGECVPIQAAYDQTLSETASEIGDIGDHLAAGDINKLQSMKGVSAEGIDSSTAKADRLVGEICQKYNTKKWFSLNKDIAPGGVFSIPNF